MDTTKKKTYSYKFFLIPKEGCPVDSSNSFDKTTVSVSWPEYFEWKRLAAGDERAVSKLVAEVAATICTEKASTRSRLVREAVTAKLRGAYRPTLTADWKGVAAQADQAFAKANNSYWDQ